MTTALDTIKGALRAIRVLGTGDSIGPDMSADGLQSLNLMLHGWRNRNVNVEHVDLVLTDDLKLDARHHEAVLYLLAVRLAPDYEQSVSAEVATLADSGWRGIQSHFAVANPLKLDGLQHMPSRRWGGTNR